MSDENLRILRIDVNSAGPMFGKTTAAAVIAVALKDRFPDTEVEVLCLDRDFKYRMDQLAAGEPLRINADLIQIVDVNDNPQPIRASQLIETTRICADLADLASGIGEVHDITAQTAASTDNAKPLWANAPEWAMWLLKDHGQYTWAEVAPDEEGGIAGRFVQAGIYTEGVSVCPEARPQPVDDSINYPERPLALNRIIANAIAAATAVAELSDADCRALTEIILNDQLLCQAAEEFECDRGDQYVNQAKGDHQDATDPDMIDLRQAKGNSDVEDSRVTEQ